MTLKSEWLSDINDMHYKFGATEWVDNMHRSKNYKVLKDFLAFRLDFLEEEFEETQSAFFKNNSKEVVDGLIDLIVIAIGTLDLFKCDADEVWKKVHEANMSKEPGINKSRRNPFGLPDMVKPEGFKSPVIAQKNCGILPEVLGDSNYPQTKILNQEEKDLENEFKNNIANLQYEE
tara:strand:- start:1089 stop:1616 length:528 start_codon:yes stop_codon:yes gene_type:complete